MADELAASAVGRPFGAKILQDITVEVDRYMSGKANIDARSRVDAAAAPTLSQGVSRLRTEEERKGGGRWSRLRPCVA
jgi:hypothetical protein